MVIPMIPSHRSPAATMRMRPPLPSSPTKRQSNNSKKQQQQQGGMVIDLTAFEDELRAPEMAEMEGEGTYTSIIAVRDEAEDGMLLSHLPPSEVQVTHSRGEESFDSSHHSQSYQQQQQQQQYQQVHHNTHHHHHHGGYGFGLLPPPGRGAAALSSPPPPTQTTSPRSARRSPRSDHFKRPTNYNYVDVDVDMETDHHHDHNNILDGNTTYLGTTTTMAQTLQTSAAAANGNDFLRTVEHDSNNVYPSEVQITHSGSSHHVLDVTRHATTSFGSDLEEFHPHQQAGRQQEEDDYPVRIGREADIILNLHDDEAFERSAIMGDEVVELGTAITSRGVAVGGLTSATEREARNTADIPSMEDLGGLPQQQSQSPRASLGFAARRGRSLTRREATDGGTLLQKETGSPRVRNLSRSGSVPRRHISSSRGRTTRRNIWNEPTSPFELSTSTVDRDNTPTTAINLTDQQQDRTFASSMGVMGFATSAGTGRNTTRTVSEETTALPSQVEITQTKTDQTENYQGDNHQVSLAKGEQVPMTTPTSDRVEGSATDSPIEEPTGTPESVSQDEVPESTTQQTAESVSKQLKQQQPPAAAVSSEENTSSSEEPRVSRELTKDASASTAEPNSATSSTRSVAEGYTGRAGNDFPSEVKFSGTGGSSGSDVKSSSSTPGYGEVSTAGAKDGIDGPTLERQQQGDFPSEVNISNTSSSKIAESEENNSASPTESEGLKEEAPVPSRVISSDDILGHGNEPGAVTTSAETVSSTHMRNAARRRDDGSDVSIARLGKILGLEDGRISPFKPPGVVSTYQQDLDGLDAHEGVERPHYADKSTAEKQHDPEVILLDGVEGEEDEEEDQVKLEKSKSESSGSLPSGQAMYLKAIRHRAGGRWKNDKRRVLSVASSTESDSGQNDMHYAQHSKLASAKSLEFTRPSDQPIIKASPSAPSAIGKEALHCAGSAHTGHQSSEPAQINDQVSEAKVIPIASDSPRASTFEPPSTTDICRTDTEATSKDNEVFEIAKETLKAGVYFEIPRTTDICRYSTEIDGTSDNAVRVSVQSVCSNNVKKDGSNTKLEIIHIDEASESSEALGGFGNNFNRVFDASGEETVDSRSQQEQAVMPRIDYDDYQLVHGQGGDTLTIPPARQDDKNEIVQDPEQQSDQEFRPLGKAGALYSSSEALSPRGADPPSPLPPMISPKRQDNNSIENDWVREAQSGQQARYLGKVEAPDGSNEVLAACSQELFDGEEAAKQKISLEEVEVAPVEVTPSENSEQSSRSENLDSTTKPDPEAQEADLLAVVQRFDRTNKARKGLQRLLNKRKLKARGGKRETTQERTSTSFESEAAPAENKVEQKGASSFDVPTVNGIALVEAHEHSGEPVEAFHVLGEQVSAQNIEEANAVDQMTNIPDVNDFLQESPSADDADLKTLLDSIAEAKGTQPQELESTFESVPTLYQPDPSGTFALDADASSGSFEAILPPSSPVMGRNGMEERMNDEFHDVLISTSKAGPADHAVESQIIKLLGPEDEQDIGKSGRRKVVYSNDLAISDYETPSSGTSGEDALYLSSSESDDDIEGPSRPTEVGEHRDGPYDESASEVEYVADDGILEESSQDASDGKISIVYSGTSESDFETDYTYDIYDACAVPFLSRLLDKGCAWLEGDDGSRRPKSSPSLLYRLQRKSRKEKGARTLPRRSQNVISAARRNAVVRMEQSKQKRSGNNTSSRQNSTNHREVSAFARPRRGQVEHSSKKEDSKTEHASKGIDSAVSGRSKKKKAEDGQRKSEAAETKQKVSRGMVARDSDNHVRSHESGEEELGEEADKPSVHAPSRPSMSAEERNDVLAARIGKAAQTWSQRDESLLIETSIASKIDKKPSVSKPASNHEVASRTTAVSPKTEDGHHGTDSQTLNDKYLGTADDKQRDRNLNIPKTSPSPTKVHQHERPEMADSSAKVVSTPDGLRSLHEVSSNKNDQFDQKLVSESTAGAESSQERDGLDIDQSAVKGSDKEQVTQYDENGTANSTPFQKKLQERLQSIRGDFPADELASTIQPTAQTGPDIPDDLVLSDSDADSSCSSVEDAGSNGRSPAVSPTRQEALEFRQPAKKGADPPQNANSIPLVASPETRKSVLTFNEEDKFLRKPVQEDESRKARDPPSFVSMKRLTVETTMHDREDGKAAGPSPENMGKPILSPGEIRREASNKEKANGPSPRNSWQKEALLLDPSPRRASPCTGRIVSPRKTPERSHKSTERVMKPRERESSREGRQSKSPRRESAKFNDPLLGKSIKELPRSSFKRSTEEHHQKSDSRIPSPARREKSASRGKVSPEEHQQKSDSRIPSPARRERSASSGKVSPEKLFGGIEKVRSPSRGQRSVSDSSRDVVWDKEEALRRTQRRHQLADKQGDIVVEHVRQNEKRISEVFRKVEELPENREFLKKPSPESLTGNEQRRKRSNSAQQPSSRGRRTEDRTPTPKERKKTPIAGRAGGPESQTPLRPRSPQKSNRKSPSVTSASDTSHIIGFRSKSATRQRHSSSSRRSPTRRSSSNKRGATFDDFFNHQTRSPSSNHPTGAALAERRPHSRSPTKKRTTKAPSGQSHRSQKEEMTLGSRLPSDDDGNEELMMTDEMMEGMNEEERLAALELVEKLRRRAATLKRRRKIKNRRLQEGDDSMDDYAEE